MKKLLFLLILILAGCQKDEFTGLEKGTFTDSRDKHQYNWVRIGDQIWMAENMAFLPSVSPPSKGSDTSPYVYVYDYRGTNVEEARTNLHYKPLGALYNWEAAKTACPKRWHLPSDEEWKILEKYLGMSDTEVDSIDIRHSGGVGGKLKESGTDHWSAPNYGGDNSSGFTALPGGYRLYNGPFQTDNSCVVLGDGAYFWTSSMKDTYSWYRSIRSDTAGITRFWATRFEGQSVRCIKD